MKIAKTFLLLLTASCLPRAYAADVLSHDDAVKEALHLKCLIGKMPVEITQRIDGSTFFGYGQYTGMRPFPVILKYIANVAKPTNVGRIMVGGPIGAVMSDDVEVPMDSGFSQKVSVVKIGDRKCGELWRAIYK